MTKHTPGPWRLVKLASRSDARVHAWGIAYGPSGNRLAIVDGEGNSALANNENARLIALAPDLADALRALIDVRNDATVREARAILAKVEK